VVSLRRQILLQVFRLSDAAIFVLALLASWAIDLSFETTTTFEVFLARRLTLPHVVLGAALTVVWVQIFERFGLYESRRFDPSSREWLEIVKAATAGTAALALAGILFHLDALHARPVLTFWTISTLVTMVFRGVLRLSLRRVRKMGRNLRSAVLVGTNPRAYEFAEMLARRRELGYRIAGCVDDGVHVPHSSFRLLGRFEDFARIIRESVVDEVIIALPIKSHYDVIQSLVGAAEEQGITVRYLPKLFETRIARASVERFDRFDLMTIASGPENHVQYPAKRFFDLLVGHLALACALPVMAFAALGIRLTSPGPVLFAQERMGYNKRVFKLYKFRTMVVNAEAMQAALERKNEMDGPVFKIRSDPRITRFGAFLRKTSIDELPQLFNVIKGDMSLVGPRPLPLRDCRGFSEDWHRRRFSVRPGITCIWQISGRNDVSFSKWMELDMSYIDNWSLWKDLSILAMTIPAVLRKRGAS
jgi:exopolysaccharide biosynthesis polyprenyl glycosylphosphotransferase